MHVAFQDGWPPKLREPPLSRPGRIPSASPIMRRACQALARAIPSSTTPAACRMLTSTHVTPPAAAPPKVAVVGGGVAGLSAAQSLLRHNLRVVLLDMGRGNPGGRLASRRLEEPGLGALSFDHGAQFFTARSPEFKRQVAQWQAEGVVAEWQGRHGLMEDGAFQPWQQVPEAARGAGGFFGALAGSPPLYVGTPTNNALCQHMAAQLRQQPQQEGSAAAAKVVSGVKVQSMAKVGGGCGCGSTGSQWQLRGSRQGRAAAAVPAPAAEEQEDLGSYDAVVLADAMPLLPGSAGHIEGIASQATSLAQLARSVQAVAPEPCFALMLAFAQPLPGVPFDSASVSDSSAAGDSSSAFQWVACNSSKPGRQAGGSPQCWVALTSPQRAQQLLERHPLTVGGQFNPQTQQYLAAITAELLGDFRTLMQPFCQGPLPEPAYCHSQRWGRAFVTEPLGAEFLFLPAQRLALCGDVATGSGVEAAWRSGRAAGEAVASMLAAAGSGV